MSKIAFGACTVNSGGSHLIGVADQTASRRSPSVLPPILEHCRRPVSGDLRHAALGERALVRTGIAIALPTGYAAFVHPRSGLAARHGVTLVNAPGTIDAGYRGEIKVILLNTDATRPVSLRRGDRIAQLVVQRVEYVRFHEVKVLPGSARGAGGFGSTGGHSATAGLAGGEADFSSK